MSETKHGPFALHGITRDRSGIARYDDLPNSLVDAIRVSAETQGDNCADPAPTRDPRTGALLRVIPGCSCGWSGDPIHNDEPDTVGLTGRQVALALAESAARTLRFAHAAHALHTGDRGLIARHPAA